MGAWSAQARDTARAILGRDPVDVASRLDVGLTAERVMQVLGKVLVPWIGAAGHGALLERALCDAVQEHPALKGLRVDAGRIVDDAPDGPRDDAGSVEGATIALLGAYIDRLGRVVGTEMALRLTEQAFARNTDAVRQEAPRAAIRKGE